MRIVSPLSLGWSRPHFASDFDGKVFAEFDRMIDSLLQPTTGATTGFSPSCDIHETKDHYFVSFDMPGVKKENIKIETRGSQLIVSGERRREFPIGDGAALSENISGKFERTFKLPNSVSLENIEAFYEDGVLRVAMPKAEAAKPRTIEIQSGDKLQRTMREGADQQSQLGQGQRDQNDPRFS